MATLFGSGVPRPLLFHAAPYGRRRGTSPSTYYHKTGHFSTGVPTVHKFNQQKASRNKSPCPFLPAAAKISGSRFADFPPRHNAHLPFTPEYLPLNYIFSKYMRNKRKIFVTISIEVGYNMCYSSIWVSPYLNKRVFTQMIVLLPFE